VSRGDVVRLPADRRARGHEQRGARYAVVIQSDELEPLSTVIVAPTSRSAIATDFRPAVSIEHTTTRVLSEQIFRVDRLRLPEPTHRLTPAEMAEVDQALRIVLDLRT
jgi:mRNA interferase MazF